MQAPFFAATEGGAAIGMLQEGEVIVALEHVTDSKGRLKIKHARGWTPERSPQGALVLEDVVSQPPEGVPPAADSSGGTANQFASALAAGASALAAGAVAVGSAGAVAVGAAIAAPMQGFGSSSSAEAALPPAGAPATAPA